MKEPILFTDMRKNEDKITHLLEKYPTLRDSDEKLFAIMVTMKEGSGDMTKGIEKIKSMSAFELLDRIVFNRYVNYTSMIRCRRLIQNKRPDLRGEAYNRRNDSDDYFRTNINK